MVKPSRDPLPTPGLPSDEQVAFALRQADGGTAVEEICRKLGVPEVTSY